ncbi:MAG TPA: hypothetical protein VGE77_03560 [Nocardioides sp.]
MPFRRVLLALMVIAACWSLPPVATASTAAPSDALTLSSLPGAKRTILLDVDGHDVRDTAWNEGHGLPAGVYEGLLPAGSSTDATRELVRLVWQRVADDFAPFAVDVTTADPGTAALERTSADDQVYGMRVLLTTSTVAPAHLCDGPCGGVAFTDAFDLVGSARQSPTWVFVDAADLAAAATDPARLPALADTIAAATSHEIGHTFGLGHDGDEEFEYHPGHDYWAPLMGHGDGRGLTQWSNGEYPGAFRREDDVAVIAANGAPRRADDHGDTVATGTPVRAGQTVRGVIGSRTDRDVLVVETTCTGTVRARVAPPTGGNLDVGLRLLGTDGASHEVGGTGTHGTSAVLGLDADLVSTLVPAGRWGVEIDGVAVVTGLDARSRPTWSDYGSLGAWEATVDTVCAATAPVDAGNVRVAPPAPGVLQVAWDVTPSAGAVPTAYEVRLFEGDHLVRGPERVTVGAASATSEASARGGRHQLGGLRIATSYRAEVRSLHGAVPGAWRSAVGRTPPGAVARLAATAVRPTSFTVVWDPPLVGADDVTAYVVTVDGISRRVPASPRRLVVDGRRAGATVTVAVRPASAVGNGAPASFTLRLPAAAVPSAPTGLSVRAGVPGPPASVQVRWGEAVANGSPVTGYYLVARPTTGSTTTRVTRLVGASARAIDLPLPAGRWTVDVHAVNRVGTGPGRRSAPVLAQ